MYETRPLLVYTRSYGLPRGDAGRQPPEKQNASVLWENQSLPRKTQDSGGNPGKGEEAAIPGNGPNPDRVFRCKAGSHVWCFGLPGDITSSQKTATTRPMLRPGPAAYTPVLRMPVPHVREVMLVRSLYPAHIKIPDDHLPRRARTYTADGSRPKYGAVLYRMK